MPIQNVQTHLTIAPYRLPIANNNPIWSTYQASDQLCAEKFDKKVRNTSINEIYSSVVWKVIRS